MMSEMSHYRSGVRSHTRSDDSMEERLGLSLPPRSRIWDCRGRIGPLDPLLFERRPRREPRLLRSLARSKLGLDRWTVDIPLCLQHRTTDLPLRTRLSRTKNKEPRVRYATSGDSPLSYCRLDFPLYLRLGYLLRL